MNGNVYSDSTTEHTSVRTTSLVGEWMKTSEMAEGDVTLHMEFDTLTNSNENTPDCSVTIDELSQAHHLMVMFAILHEALSNTITPVLLDLHW